MHCSLIAKDLSGAVGTIQIDGNHFSMFVDERGNVWVCGRNKKKELGVDHTEKQESFWNCCSCRTKCLFFKQGNIYTCGYNQYGQQKKV